MSKILSDKEKIDSTGHTCKKCGREVFEYTCNKEICEQRKEASQWDWWASCSNEDCENHYGEGFYQDRVEWINYNDFSAWKQPLENKNIAPIDFYNKIVEEANRIAKARQNSSYVYVMNGIIESE